jgi:hypothetical protein
MSAPAVRRPPLTDRRNCLLQDRVAVFCILRAGLLVMLIPPAIGRPWLIANGERQQP